MVRQVVVLVELESSDTCDMDVATDGVREGEVGWLFDENKISSDRPNAGLRMVRQGRSEAGCQSVAVVVTPLTLRCRASIRTCERPGKTEMCADSL
jgi:hypothetical protein